MRKPEMTLCQKEWKTLDSVLGFFAFAAFFLGDYNDWKWGIRGLRLCFPAGVLLLIAGTIWMAMEGTAPSRGVPRGMMAALAVIFFLLLVRTLFFALPAEASYTRPGERRPVRRSGVYALCRHPGVLWFGGLYLCLWPALGVPLWAGAAYTGLDVLLVLFEDRRVFPAVLDGYPEYRKVTPFLIPTADSIRACVKEK